MYNDKSFNLASKIPDPAEASSMTGEESALPVAITMKWRETSKGIKCLAIGTVTMDRHTVTMHMIQYLLFGHTLSQCTTQTDPPELTLHSLTVELDQLTNLIKFGILLRVPQSILEVIQHNHLGELMH